jgi:hypothetical protein
MMIPLSALAFDTKLDPHDTLLKQWFWSKSFTQAYDAAANTRLVSDYKELSITIKGDDAFSPETIDAGLLLAATRKSSKAVWAAFLCALCASSRGGFFVEERVTDSEEDTILEIPWLEPVLVLPKDPQAGRDPSAWHLRVLNLLLAPASVASRVHREGLFKVATDHAANHGKTITNAFLESSFLPPLDELERALSRPEWLLQYRIGLLSRFLAAETQVNLLNA